MIFFFQIFFWRSRSFLKHVCPHLLFSWGIVLRKEIVSYFWQWIILPKVNYFQCKHALHIKYYWDLHNLNVLWFLTAFVPVPAFVDVTLPTRRVRTCGMFQRPKTVQTKWTFRKRIYLLQLKIQQDRCLVHECINKVFFSYLHNFH